MYTLHFFLQNKGGVGKTTLASFFSQYLISRGKPVVIVDADPSNKSLLNYTGLKIAEFDYMSDNIADIFKFDPFFDSLLDTLEDNSHCVFDVGASGYNDFMNYLFQQDDSFDILSSQATIYMHNIIPSSRDMVLSCIGGLKQAIDNTKKYNVPFILWQNRMDGEIKIEGDNKTYLSSIKETNIFNEIRDRAYIVEIEDLTPKKKEILASAVHKMIRNTLTLKQVVESDLEVKFTRQDRIRCKSYMNRIYDQLDKIFNYNTKIDAIVEG